MAEFGRTLTEDPRSLLAPATGERGPLRSSKIPRNATSANVWKSNAITIGVDVYKTFEAERNGGTEPKAWDEGGPSSRGKRSGRQARGVDVFGNTPERKWDDRKWDSYVSGVCSRSHARKPDSTWKPPFLW
ncbi:hypothetical protein MRX96_030964 [Rhipicephalus microplus]